MRFWLILGLFLGILAEEIQIDPGCPTGYTGSGCNNPICPSPSTLQVHDGEENKGDTIASFHSPTCQDTFYFPVDNFITNLYVSVVVSSKNSFPIPTLFDPAGNQYPNDGQQYISETEMVVLFAMDTAPRGLYSMTVSSQQKGDCRLKMTSTTKLSIDGGFVEDKRDDQVVMFDPSPNQGITRYPLYNTTTYLAFRVRNEQFPVVAQSVRIMRDGYSDQIYDVFTRYNCSYPHITGEGFNCTDYAMYSAEFTGIDSSGNIWQRVYDFICDASSATQSPVTGTPSSPPPVDECYNEGKLTPNGTCYCGEYFEGTECELKLCMNGGTLNQFTDICICPDGWSGDNCQHVMCDQKAQDKFYVVPKALGFVIRSAQSMQGQIGQIVQAAQQLTNYTYFQVYILSVVQNGEILFTHTYTDPASFIGSIGGIIHPPVDTVCSDSLLLGVNAILNEPEFQQYPESPIYVFSDGVLNDGYATQGYALQQMSLYRPQLYFILSDSAGGTCDVDISSEGYQVLIGYAAFSQGLAVKVPLSQLANTVNRLTSLLFDSNILTQNDLLDCRRAPTYSPFFIDESIGGFWISATGNNLTLTLTYPDLSIHTPLEYFYTGNLHIWVVDNAKSGAYMLNLKSNSGGAQECSYRVTGTSAYHAFFGASTDVRIDIQNKQPVFGVDSHLVARINNLRIQDPVDISAEITIWTNYIDSSRIVLYSSSGLWRDGCQYDIYFGSFQCSQPGLGFYVSIYFTDNRGLTILRTTTGYCSAALPPSPGEECQNGGVTYNGTCICPSHFNGDKCQFVQCENQGTPKFGACICPPGFAGQFCETIACTQTNQFIFSDPDYRSLSFLMHDSITTRAMFRTVNDVAPRIIHDIVHQHSRWFMNYQLIRFNDTDFQSLTDSKNPEDFINAINQAYQINQQNSYYSCANLDFYRTLLFALRDDHVARGGVFYVFLNGMPRPDSDSYDQIIDHIEGSLIQIHVVQFSMNPCGQDYTKDGLMAIAQASGGTYFLASAMDAGDVVRTLPTLHSSGLIYERFVDNCADTTFYVPIDANTQSVTAYIQGELTTDPIYTRPDGKMADRFSVTNIWNDIGYDSRMDQIIQSCDPGWSLNNGHCFYFDGFTATWEQAQAKCQSFGGTLATVYSQLEQNWLNYAGSGAAFWIGLNDRDNINQWVWALSDGNTLNLNSTHYTNWAKGQPPNTLPNTEDNRCVVDDNLNKTGWIATNCLDQYYFACSKDVYNSEFEAGDNSTKNYIPRGVWSIRVQADGPCSILLRAQSTLQVLPLYTPTLHSDFGFTTPVNGITTNRLIAHVTGLKPGTTHSLEYGHVYSDDGHLLQTQTVSHRDATCSYDYVSTPFQCVSPAFQMMLTGVDSFGYMYQRVVPVLCLEAPSSNSCENNGVFYDGFCVCPPNFYGLHCEYIYCMNGGIPSGGLGNCICNDAYQGRFCELPRCNRGGIVPDISTDGKTFIVAIDGSSSGDMANVLSNISKTLTTVLQGIDNSYPGWFTSYVAVVFRDKQVPDGNVFLDTIIATQIDDFVTKISKQLNDNPYTSKTTSRAIFNAISIGLSQVQVKENSLLWVLTNSKAEDISNEDLALSATARTHTSINFIFIGDQTAPGGGNDYTDPAVADLYEAAHNSGGSAYQVATTADLTNTWRMILSSWRGSYTIISHHITNCSSYTDFIQLGSNGTEIIIDVAQGDPNITVSNANGTTVKAVPLFISKNNLLTSFDQRGNLPGIWGITINGKSDTCMFNVRGNSDLNIITAFTQDVEIDGGFHDGSATAYPKANGQSNAVVVAVNGGGSLNYVQILDMEEHSVIWSAPLVKRALCAYGYISAQTFICDRPSFLLAVDGLDVIGHPFRRLLTFHCQGYIPPTPPTKPTTPTTMSQTTMTTMTPYPMCDPSVPSVDMVFVMDGSDGVTGEEYGEILKYFIDMFHKFYLTQSRILLSAYSTNGNFFDSTLDSIQTTQQLTNKIMQLLLSGYTEQVGNNIDDVLSQLNTTILPKAPFKSDRRKLIVFISSLGWDKGNFYDGTEHGFNDPNASINALKALGAEFIPIGFGTKANMDQLSAFSTKCVQHAARPSDFALITQFIESNICSSTPQC